MAEIALLAPVIRIDLTNPGSSPYNPIDLTRLPQILFFQTISSERRTRTIVRDGHTYTQTYITKTKMWLKKPSRFRKHRTPDGKVWYAKRYANRKQDMYQTEHILKETLTRKSPKIILRLGPQPSEQSASEERYSGDENDDMSSEPHDEGYDSNSNSPESHSHTRAGLGTKERERLLRHDAPQNPRIVPQHVSRLRLILRGPRLPPMDLAIDQHVATHHPRLILRGPKRPIMRLRGGGTLL